MGKKKKGKHGKPHRLIPLIVAAALFSLTLCSCVGTPRSRAELEAMDQAKFDNWKARLTVIHEEAGYALVKHAATNAETADRLAAAYTALAGQPIPAGALQGLADAPEYSGLLRLAVLELQAFLGDGEIEASLRIQDVLGACAQGLAAGKNRALAETAPPSPP